ncbi:uncharacterized protein LOC142178396 [Nicotiana tabacum]|uniref:Uncharacterized protein LOC142178396 n=1 Tax=Nicotiana tabacum TaxID=4097 RepID=A0AC58U2X0_TOBAC
MDVFDNILATKRRWRFRTIPSLWATFMIHKYCSRSHPVSKKNAFGNSHIWQKMRKVRDKAEPHIFWLINLENSSMWWDNWTGKGPLASLLSYTNNSPKVLVKEFILHGNWNIHKLRGSFLEDIDQIIMNVNIRKHDIPNQSIWDLTENVKYSNKTVLNMFRDLKPKDHFLSKVWHPSIPFKVFFLTWRLWMSILLFDEVILNFGKKIVSRCVCCTNHSNEFIQYVFMESDATRYIWKLIGTHMGIIHKHIPIRGWFNHWWQQRSKNVIHKQVLQITLIIVCWEIWKNRCSCKYGDQNRFNFYKMKQQIIWNIQAAVHRTFPRCKLTLPWVKYYDDMMRLKPVPEAIIVAWRKPLQGSFKLNINGSYIHENGKACLGGTMRNDQGDFIMAFSVQAKCSSNNDAEAQAALFGIKWCIQNGYSNFNI